MGGISKVKDDRGNIKYRASIHRKGFKPINKRFTDINDAKRWIREQESSIETAGLPLTIDALRKYTLAQLVNRYLTEKTPAKGCATNEAIALSKFLRHPICKQSLPISRQDAQKYINERLKDTWKGKPITPRTVARDKRSIQHIFEVARKEWGLANLPNPFSDIEIKGSTYRRKRRLEDGELDALIKHSKECLGLNNYYVPFAIYLAVETGMRLSEIFNLRWNDIDIHKRTITITKSKTDHLSDTAGRTIVMPAMSMMKLMMVPKWNNDDKPIVVHKSQYFGTLVLGKELFGHLPGFPNVSTSEGIGYVMAWTYYFNTPTPIFPMSKEAFEQAFKKLIIRAKKECPSLNSLQFRDLRREAGSRFDEADLSDTEHDLMMGHNSNEIRDIYIRRKLNSIQDKLDRYEFNGKTLKEYVESIRQKHATNTNAHSRENNTPP